MVVPGADSHIVILEEGTLMIESVKQEDAGEYVCVATNAAGTVQSRPAVLEVYGELREKDRVYVCMHMCVHTFIYICMHVDIQM